MCAMCDLSYHTASNHGAFESRLAPPFANYIAAKADSDSSSCSSEGDDQLDDNYLELRWSQTAKFLREFTQRKNAQAEVLKQQRAMLPVLSADERSAALSATSPEQSPLASRDRRVLDRSELRPMWLDPQLPTTASPALRHSQTIMRGPSLSSLQSAASGGGAGSATLDALLQSVLQRSTAVSTKLTKAYAHPVEQEKDPGPLEPRTSHTCVKRMASHVRGRSLSRIHRHTMNHPREEDTREPPPASQYQQQRQQRLHASNSTVSPVSTRSVSPTGLPPPAPLPQLPGALPSPAPAPAPAPAQQGTAVAGEEELRPHVQGEQQQPQQQARPRAPQVDTAREQPRQQPGGATMGEVQQQQQLPLPLAKTAPHVNRSSSSCFKASTGALGRDPLSRRGLSRSLDGMPRRPRRRSNGPYTTSGEGGAAHATSPSASPSGGRTLRPFPGSGSGGSSGGVRLPYLNQAGSKSGGGGGGGDARAGALAAGGKLFEALASGSSNNSSNSGGEAARRRAAMVRTAQQQGGGLRSAGSVSYGLTSPTVQSPWAKSTSTRELVFTQF